MPEKRNALAELAEKLKADEDVLRTYKEELGVGDNEIGGLVIADIRTASHIVAMLAKVNGECWKPLKNGQCSYFCYATDSRIQCTICKCRAIAEEGSATAPATADN